MNFIFSSTMKSKNNARIKKNASVNKNIFEYLIYFSHSLSTSWKLKKYLKPKSIIKIINFKIENESEIWNPKALLKISISTFKKVTYIIYIY